MEDIKRLIVENVKMRIAKKINEVIKDRKLFDGKNNAAKFISFLHEVYKHKDAHQIQFEINLKDLKKHIFH